MPAPQSTRVAPAIAVGPATRPGMGVRILCRLVRWRATLPGWKVEVLRGLAASEAQGVAALRAVLPSIRDARLRELVQRHADDEARHVRLFAERLREVAGEGALADLGLDATVAEGELPPTVSGLNEVALLAMFEATEIRGHAVLATYADLFADDPRTRAVVDSVVADERFHVTYTHEELERLVTAGHGAMVRAARRWARRYERGVFWRQARAFLRQLPRLVAHHLSRPFRRRRAA